MKYNRRSWKRTKEALRWGYVRNLGTNCRYDLDELWRWPERSTELGPVGMRLVSQGPIVQDGDYAYLGLLRR